MSPAAIASEVRADEQWLVALCTLADKVAADEGTSLVPDPGTFCMHVMHHGRVPS